jgi:hypothetical protein
LMVRAKTQAGGRRVLGRKMPLSGKERFGAPMSATPPDPDWEGLPPGVVLPERRLYARKQLWALLVFNAIALAVMLVFLWGASRQSRVVVAVCTAAVGALVVVNAVRWWRLR